MQLVDFSSKLALRGSLVFHTFIQWLQNTGSPIPVYILSNPRVVEDIFKLGLIQKPKKSGAERLPCDLPHTVIDELKAFKAYLEANNIVFPEVQRMVGDTQTITYVASLYFRNLVVSVVKNFFKRQKASLMVSRVSFFHTSIIRIDMFEMPDIDD